MDRLLEISDYKKVPNREKYDFSNECASDYYCNLSGFKKFFAYMMMVKGSSFSKNEKYPLFSNAVNEIKKVTHHNLYGKIIDPDSQSLLLQKIYKKLWNINIKLDDNEIFLPIQGETLNSANTTLNVLYEIIEDENEKNERKKDLKTGKKEQLVSIKYIISRYLSNNSKTVTSLMEYEEVEKFLSAYHTIGNFMPVPIGCNSPRGIGPLKDYFDLTLLHIYNYYINHDIEEIKPIVKSDMTLAILYKDWLDSFGSWPNFINDNYLKAFVDENNYPLELWNGHFKQIKNVYPQSKAQCQEYFVNASKCIYERSLDMLAALDDDKEV